MENSQMELQHINVKLFLRNPELVELEPLVPVFQSWIQDQKPGELLIDVADYRHVEAGPGVILIGYEGDYSVDNTDGRLGVRYNRKAALGGSNQDRLKQAALSAITACQRLESEPRLGGKIGFDGQTVEISVNDRLLAPNNNATREAIKSDFEQFAQKLFRGSEYSTSYETDPRRLFAVTVKAAQTFFAADLLERLS
jgi:hypothetical protein